MDTETVRKEFPREWHETVLPLAERYEELVDSIGQKWDDMSVSQRRELFRRLSSTQPELVPARAGVLAQGSAFTEDEARLFLAILAAGFPAWVPVAITMEDDTYGLMHLGENLGGGYWLGKYDEAPPYDFIEWAPIAKFANETEAMSFGDWLFSLQEKELAWADEVAGLRAQLATLRAKSRGKPKRRAAQGRATSRL